MGSDHQGDKYSEFDVFQRIIPECIRAYAGIPPIISIHRSSYSFDDIFDIEFEDGITVTIMVTCTYLHSPILYKWVAQGIIEDYLAQSGDYGFGTK